MLPRMRALAAAAAALLGSGLACHDAPAPLFPAGSIYDDGHGDLALASTKLLTPEPAAPPAAPRPPREVDPDSADLDLDSDDPDGAAASADDAAYGGSTYAGFVVPAWRPAGSDRKPRYRQAVGLTGAIEGVVSWRGAVPGKLATACGAIEPLALDDGKALGGALVYIEKVAVGRPLATEGKLTSVGGLVVKRGCALGPAVQVATPLPSPLIVHGDARRASIRVTPPAGPPRTYDLAEAGRVGLQLGAPGVTRIDAADGSFASAWVVALETPYYALTDDHGRFRLDELAAGAYEVTIWQPPVPTVAGGALTYGPPIVAKRTVRVESARTARLDVALGR